MQFTKLLLLTCATFAAVSSIALADDGVLAPRQVPAKTLPVPSNVSPELQKLIGAPYKPSWNVLWKTSEEWRAAANAQAAHVVPTLAAMRERLGVTAQRSTMDGVPLRYTTPFTD